MLKKLMLAAAATSALAFTAPTALADDPPQLDCGFDSNQQEDVTGQNYEGVVYGYIVHEGPVSLSCTIRVNGSDVAGASNSGDNAAVVGGRVTFAASDTDHVQLCYEYTTAHGSGSGCFETTHIQIPPQAVIDALNDLMYNVIDPAICPVLAGLAGTYGPVVVNSQGDIYVAGEPQWDCPPYDIWPPE